MDNDEESRRGDVLDDASQLQDTLGGRVKAHGDT